MTLIRKNINVNFQVSKGDSFNQTFEFVDCVDSVETPIDLAGSTLEFLVKDKLGITFIIGSTSLTGSPANVVNVNILGVDTNIYPSVYEYHLKVTGIGSPIEINTYIIGTFEILE